MADPPLTGLSARYRADTEVTDAGAGRVSAWGDMTANSFDLAQGTAGNRPLLVSSVLNGQPIIRFDRSRPDFLLRASTPTDTQPFTLVAVVKVNDVGNSPFLCVFGGADNFTQLTYNGDGNDRFLAFAGSSLSGSAGVAVDNTWYGVAAVFDGASSAIYQDRTQVAAGNVGSLDFEGLRVGQYFDASGSVTMDLAEILVYDHALDASELTALFDYIYIQYGLGTAPAGSIVEAEGLGEFVAVGAPIASGVASLAGTGAAAFVGSGIATGAFSISAAGAAAFNSANFLDMALSSAGVGAAAFVGFDDTGGVLAAAGSGQAAWTGRTVKDIVLSAPGTSICGWSSEATEIEFFMEGFSNCQWIGSPLGGRNWIPDTPAPDGWVAQEPVA